MTDPQGTPEPRNPLDRPHDGSGRFVRSLETAERDAEAARLHATGMTWAKIAKHMGYAHKGKAYEAATRAMQAAVKPAGEALAALLVARAEDIYLRARDIANRDHPTVQNGRVVEQYDEDENDTLPVVDDTPKLAALDRMDKALDRIAKLRKVYGPIQIEDVTLDAVQAKIARLEQEARDAGEAI